MTLGGTDGTTARRGSAADAEQALFALEGQHPFVVVRNGKRIEAVWRHALRGPGIVLGNAEWRYRVTLLGETGQYTTSVLAKNWDTGNDFFSFRSSDVSRPVEQALASVGWTRRPNPFTRFFRGLTGRTGD